MIKSILCAGAFGVAAAMLAGAAQAASVVEVDAGFLIGTAFIEVKNGTPIDFDSVKLNSVGGSHPGETLDMGPLAHQGVLGDLSEILFEAPSGAFSGFYNDVTDGETSYQLELTAGPKTYLSSIFSPSSNASGHYVDFLGLYSGQDFDPVEVATASVPEPASWALMIAGFGLAGAAMRRRRTWRSPAAAAQIAG